MSVSVSECVSVSGGQRECEAQAHESGRVDSRLYYIVYLYRDIWREREKRERFIYFSVEC